MAFSSLLPLVFGPSKGEVPGGDLGFQAVHVGHPRWHYGRRLELERGRDHGGERRAMRGAGCVASPISGENSTFGP